MGRPLHQAGEARRGQGPGRATMLALEDLLRADGITELGLNVVGTNRRAHTLHASLGFHETAIEMLKELWAGLGCCRSPDRPPTGLSSTV